MMIRNKGKKAIALYEIALMVVSTLAFAFILGQGLGVVSAAPEDIPTTDIVTVRPSSLSEMGVGSAAEQTAGEQAFFDAWMEEDINSIGVSAPSKSSSAITKWKTPKGVNPTATKMIVPAKLESVTLTKEHIVGGTDSVSGKLSDVVINPDGKSGTAMVGNKKVQLTPEGIESLRSEGAIQSPTEAKILGMTFKGGMAHLMTGLQWSLFVVGAIQVLGRLFGASDNLVNSLSIAAFAGIMTWKLGLAGAEQFGWLGGKSGMLWNSAGFIGIAVAAVVFIMLYKEQKQKIVTFECLPWQPPLGGAQCEQCNKDSFRPCSEYRCKSLGQACQLLNSGTGKEMCTWVSKFDVNSPIITINDAALRPYGLKYIENTNIRPPMRGFKVVDLTKADGCLQAFTPLQFGIKTNEPAQCKVEYEHSTAFKDMQFYMDQNNLFEYNHTQRIKLPSPNNNETGVPELKNGGSYDLYIRCQDANGNQNVDEFVMSYCVSPSPDTTAPIIESTSIVSGSPVRYAVDNVPIDVYVNEPSDCRWSRIDMAYNDMNNTMNCVSNEYEVNANLQYACSANLTGIKDREDNNFFFRCQDKKNNVNSQSYKLLLKGSQPLTIVKASPNGTISGSTTVTTINLEIETSNGAQDGRALCYYQLANVTQSAINNAYIQMFETDSFTSKQSLDLTGQDYKVFFRCIDNGGNIAETNTTFTLFVDKASPVVTRIYRELPDALKVVTNENSQCSYSLTTCNFNAKDGIPMLYANANNNKVSFAQWKASQTYYIKCKDPYGNEPSPDACSIIAGAAQLSSVN